jgi:GNAT superfamily N-acetyltransferase
MTDPVTIQHYPTIMNTPALPLAVKGWDFLLRYNLCDPGAMIVQYDHQGIVATRGGQPIGVLTWFDQAWGNQLGVGVAFVLAEHRRQGIHTQMWQALVVKARGLKRPVIISSTGCANAAARAAMAQQGRVITSFNVRFVVPPLPDLAPAADGGS